MKSIDELKQEQYDLKVKLHEIIEFINGEEYFELSPREKGLIGQQRAGMEMYLNALTNRIYSKNEYSFDATSAIGMMLMSNIIGGSSWGSSSSKATEDLKKMVEESDFEKKEDDPENEIRAVPV